VSPAPSARASKAYAHNPMGSYLQYLYQGNDSLPTHRTIEGGYLLRSQIRWMLDAQGADSVH
jgi:hypothetical protein